MRRRAALVPDCGRFSGLGHLGRCVALAQALVRRGWDVSVVARDATARRFVRGAHIPVVGSTHGSWHMLVVDSYRRPSAFLSAHRGRADILVAIDDQHLVRAHEADRILRPTLGERSSGRVRGGGDYALLRSEWWPRRPSVVRTRVSRILITLGGYPSSAVVAAAASAVLNAVPTATMDVVLGAGSWPAGVPAPPRVRVHTGIVALRPLLVRSDLVITAGGQTLYEVLAAGRPAIVLVTADNQLQQVRAAHRARAIRLAPHPIGDGSGALAAAVHRVAIDVRLRRSLAAAGRRLIDGRGAIRSAAWLSAA